MENSHNRFAGRVILVTGAAGGVGRAATLSFAAEGGRVYATDINEERLAAVAAEAEAAGNPIVTGVHDVTTQAACQAIVDAAVAEYGQLDVLVNVAGIAWSEHVTNVTEDAWSLMMAINLNAPFWLSQRAIPHLLETGGNVVNVGSNAGIQGQAYTVPYCVSKAGILHMTRAMAMEYIKTPIRFNAIAPGGMQTGMVDNYQMPADVDFDLMAPYMGFRGMADPQTAANGIVYLASDDASRCTGTVLSIDGGLTAG